MKELGKYEILEEIGRGGFAVVYKARDTTLDRIVALKVLRPDVAEDNTFVQRFKQEARTAAGLYHPHIITIYEVGEEAGQHYLAMAFLPGQTLDERLAAAEEPLPLAQTVSIVEQVASALDAIHQRGLVHRDIKPTNIIVDGAGQATILDFGIVRAADGTQLTTTGAVMGTPQYMSPEQAEGKEIDHRSDIYSLGVVAYQMYTGQAPFDAVSPLVVLRLHADKPPPAPRELNPQLPIEVEQVLLKALAKKRDERYQSAGELAGDLRRATEQAQRQLRRPQRKVMPVWAWWAAAGGAILVVLLGLGLALGSRLFETSPAPTEAPTEPPAEPGVTWTRPADGMVMVYVPAGEFEMGSTEGDDDEQPVHTVALDGFWIDQTEVTNAQFAAFLNERGDQVEGDVPWLGLEDEDSLIERVGNEYRPKTDYADHPVVELPWYGAAAYCDWAEARLPTEAEWEYAARGSDGRTYPWGDSAPDCDKANYWGQDGGCVGDTSAVGLYPAGASWCGALDIAGNVWEWVADWYGAYLSGRQVNPTGPSSGEKRVLRGGSWLDGQYGARCAYRYERHPDYWDIFVGFRCARVSR
jgi:formylglycine-generating enzyme required for sulfatase activity/tRNA A-37 threonylcarbamoyl transferase component Bud32